MKVALVLLDTSLQGEGLVRGVDYEFVVNSHDEWQIETRPSVAQFVGEQACTAMAKSGTLLAFLCPISGTFKTGNNWAETH